MVKRTQKEIERDYLSIKEAAKTSKSFKDVEKMTGLKYYEIMTSLKKHPIVLERIKKQFEEAQESAKTTKTNLSVERANQKIVIDTSVTGIPDIEKILEAEASCIVLTQIVIKELSQMQHFNDADAMRARHILAMPAENEEKFIHELISEEYESADKCILNYCLENKDDVILYTADKEMFNYAKVYKIPVKLFRALPKKESDNKKTTTFVGLVRIGKDLVIDLDRMNNKYKKVRLISEGQEYEQGIIKVKVGDEILLASKRKEGHVSFAHYLITSLWEQNHCMLLFSRRLYDLDKLAFNHTYKSFLRDFKRMIA